MSDAIPTELRYTDAHEWVRVSDAAAAAAMDGAGYVIRVGITHFAQDALGDVVYVNPGAVGTEVAAGDPVGEVESTKSVSDIYAPVGGVVEAVNEALDSAPDLINTDPYGEGWIVELRISDLSGVDGLLGAAEYGKLLAASTE